MPGIRTSTDVEEKDTSIHEMYRSACCREKRSSGRYSLHLIVGLIPNLCILNCLNETGILDVACIIPKWNTLQPLHQEGLPSLLSPWKLMKTGCKTQNGTEANLVLWVKIGTGWQQTTLSHRWTTVCFCVQQHNRFHSSKQKSMQRYF